jgi:hypothetical protein
VKVLFDFPKSTSQPAKQIFMHWNPRILSGFESLCVWFFNSGSAKHEFQTENLCWEPLASILQDLTRAVNLDITKAQCTVEGGKTNI